MSSAAELDRNWTEGRFSSQDGLTLYGRHYAAVEPGGGRPVVCLPGLTRNSRDFHLLATYLSSQARPNRDVYCLDYRGRGQSDYDDNWQNYTPFVELLDTLDYLTVNDIHNAAVVGTSRGGIIAMMMAVLRPTAVSVCVLNDIGPVIETGGLARIIGYVGKTPVPATWEDATRIVRDMSKQYFTDLTDAEWEVFARQIFADEDGRPKVDYDTKLANTMEEIDLSHKIPEMWPQFTALGQVPTLVLRGENSDLLSEQTLADMQAKHPNMTAHTVPEQGHPPLLLDRPTIDLVAQFIARHDAR